jgi:putative transposase
MRKSISCEQEAGVKVSEVCRRHGMSEATFYKWKSKFGGMDVSEAKRLKGLELENTELKKMVAELSLDKRALEAALRKKY